MMSETLTLVLLGRDTLDGGGELHHARIDVDHAAAEVFWQRMRSVEAIRKTDPDFFEMSWRDYRPRWFEEPAAWWDFEEEDHEYHGFYHAIDVVNRDSGAGTFVGAAVPQSEAVDIDGVTMKVQEDLLYWEGYYKSGQNTPVHTFSLDRADLLRARLYLALSEEVQERFADLVRYAPKVALDVVEQGVCPGLGYEPRQLDSVLSRDLLLPLLQAEDNQVRQRAILAVGDLAPGAAVETGRSR